MIEFVLNAIVSGVTGNAAYDAVKLILGTKWDAIFAHRDNPESMRHEIQQILNDNQQIKTQLQNLYAQPPVAIQINDVKGIGVVHGGNITQTIS